MLRGDDPIKKSSEDALGRSPLANEIANLIRNFGASDGAVIGIFGPWGSGKTSLINMIEEALSSGDPIPVLHFNPWLFSGTEQLVERFFSDIALQLGHRSQAAVKGIARSLALYGKVLSPLKGVPIAGALVTALEGVPEASQALHDLMEAQEGGVGSQREKLTNELSELDRPIVVVIDDIDRLTPSEVREILKLVRLTGNFPRIIYVLAFDRARVESVLTEPGVSGREYLKKIIQVPIDLPVVPPAALGQLLVEALDEVLLEAHRSAIVRDVRWQEVLWRVIRPLVRTIRDVRQYVASLSVTLGVIGENVSLVDLLGIEAIRVFLPDTFSRIVKNQDAFTGLADTLMPWEEEAVENRRKKQIQKAAKKAGSQKPVVKGLIRTLFPAAERHLEGHQSDSGPAVVWRRAKRVADAAVLAYYLEHVAGSKLQGMQEAERLLPLIGNRALIENLVQELDPAVWPDVIGSWWLAVDEIPTSAIPQIVAAVINLVAAAPDRHRRPFEYDTRSTGLGLILRLLARIGTDAERDATVQTAMTEIDTILGKVELLELVAEQSGSESALISASMMTKLKASVLDEIGSATADRLSAERELFHILSWAKRNSEGEKPILAQPLAASVARALLKSARRRTVTRSSASIVATTEVGLAFQELVALLDGEGNVRQLISGFQSDEGDPELAQAVILVRQYLDRKAQSEGT